MSSQRRYFLFIPLFLVACALLGGIFGPGAAHARLRAHVSRPRRSGHSNNPHVNGRLLRFETDGCRVVLQGSVKSYFQKQMAQEMLMRLDGINRVDNNLEVCWT